VKVQDLSGRELDHYVALAIGAELTRDTIANEDKTGFPLSYRAHGNPPGFALLSAGIVLPWNPSTNWAQGGPLVNRIVNCGYVIMRTDACGPVRIMNAFGAIDGRDLLEAAMRALVASKFGEEVPDA